LSTKELLDIELTVFSNSNKAWRADHCGNKQLFSRQQNNQKTSK